MNNNEDFEVLDDIGFEVLGDVGFGGEVYVNDFTPVVKRSPFSYLLEAWCTGTTNGTTIPVAVPQTLKTTIRNGVTYYYTWPLKSSFPYNYMQKDYVVNVKSPVIDFSKY